MALTYPSHRVGDVTIHPLLDEGTTQLEVRQHTSFLFQGKLPLPRTALSLPAAPSNLPTEGPSPTMRQGTSNCLPEKRQKRAEEVQVHIKRKSWLF